MGSKRIFGRFGLVALAVLFVVAVTLLNVGLRGLRLDLTENRLYTLSDGTYRILDAIPEPVNLYFFYSDRATGDIPQLRTYATRVEETLREFEQYADGKLNLTVVDPLPFSEEEDRAAAFGLQSIALPGGTDPIYFGIAGTNSIGDEEIISFLDPSKESFLEYDLAKLVYTLSNPEKAVIGLLSTLPMTAGFDPQTQQMRPPWLIAEQVQQLFDLRSLPNDLAQVDEDVDVLMIVHPKELSRETQYAIDQFVMRGGRALIFVDPYSEADAQPAPMPGMPSMGGGASELTTLLDAWGVRVPPGVVIGDDRLALTVSGMGNRPVRFLPLIGLDRSGLADDDVTTATLGNLNLGFSGWIETLEEPAASITPLMTSSDLAGEIPAASLAMLSDPAVLRENFNPSGNNYVLAARLQGDLPSAFPDGPPPLPDSDATTEDSGHLSKTTEPANLILVADTDLLTDRLWAQSQNLFGQRLVTAFAGNGDFVTNALDNLTGSSDLISIRGRATYTRPFTRVQDLRREAEEQFRLREQQLQLQLDETEAKLAELQASREDASALILSPEQEAELDRFRDQRLQIRKELRQVQRNLDQSIEDLGMQLKVINIGLIPLVITVLAIGLWWLRRQRQNVASNATGSGDAAA
jgi:ABC-type uncharacterized transport system involved in gliding motility auxiliary subunit